MTIKKQTAEETRQALVDRLRKLGKSDPFVLVAMRGGGIEPEHEPMSIRFDHHVFISRWDLDQILAHLED